MKTTNKYFSKYCSFAIFMLMFSLMLTSCKKEDGKGVIRNPIPSENPVSFGAAAETKVISVENLLSIHPENETDIRQYDSETAITTIKNDWITIVTTNIGCNRKLTIEVKENTLNTTRTYNLTLSGVPRTTILVITQNGKVN